MLNPYGLDVLSLPFKTIGTSDVATVAVPELKPMFSIVPVEAAMLIVISVMPVIFHAKCLGFKKTVFSFETMMISGLLFLSLMTWRNELLLLGILIIVYSTWCWKLEPKCKVSSKMLSRIVLFSISVVALEFGAVLFYSTLSATDQKSISLERAFQAMREDGAVSGTGAKTFTLFLGDLRLLPFFLFLQGGDLAIDVFDTLWHGTFLSFGYYRSLSSF